MAAVSREMHTKNKNKNKKLLNTCASSLLPSLMRVLPACWKTLLRIENISLGDPYLWRAQHQCATFPHLRCCTLSASVSRWTSTEHKDTLASFLTRHPALESIRIKDTPSFGSWPSTSARISLPALWRLRAPHNFPVSIRSD